MSASPVPVSNSGMIAVAPSSLAAAGAVVIALAAEVRAVAPAQLGADLIGDAHCAAALASASRLVVQALDASAGSLDDMARALRTAAGAYELADVLAIAPEQS